MCDLKMAVSLIQMIRHERSIKTLVVKNCKISPFIIIFCARKALKVRFPSLLNIAQHSYSQAIC